MRWSLKRPPVERRALSLLLGALALGVGGALYLALRGERVEVTAVRREDVSQVLAVTGRVEPRFTIQVKPLVSGEVVELPRVEGDRVKTGELLGRIDARAYEARVAQSRAAVAATRAELAQARRDLERARQLYRKGAAARVEFERARLLVQQLARRVNELEAATRVVRTEAGYHVLRAPIDGEVLDRPVDPGQAVGPQTVVYLLATTERPRVEAEVDERYLDDVALGQPAVLGPVGSAETHAGRVTWVSAQVDPRTGAGLIRLTFDRAPPPLPIGASVDVNVLVARREDVLTVPRAAVRGTRDGREVLVVNGRRAVPRRVRVIDWPAERVVVRDGLREGDRVVLDPASVSPGERLRPVETGEPHAPGRAPERPPRNAGIGRGG